MRRLPHLIAIACWAAASPATASPATDFLEAVRAHLVESYFPKPGVDVAAVLDEARRNLDATCAPLGDACPTETGVEAARTAVAALGDAHTRLDRAGGPSRGPTAAASPMGWMVKSVRGGEDLYVAWLAPDGPAARAGVRRHDRVTAAEGETAAMLSALDAPRTVVLTRGGQTIEVALEPEAGRGGPMPRLDRVGDVAVLQVPSGSTQGMAQAAHDLIARAQAEDARALILDLRDNGGGGVQCAAMVSAFVAYSTVMTDREGYRRVLTVAPGDARIVADDNVEALTLERPARWAGPMAILVNDNTGSCSEAVAIQASLAGRALIVGEPTVGVGNNTIQPAPLPEGWRLLMTTAWSTTLEGEGLPPRPPLDIEVEDDPLAIAATGRDRVLEAAVEHLSR